jgi:K(+)-stimulated pyrophosphate-energized sodium pump
VGDPFKDTTSVALNPIIKFSTLFGMLAVEIAVQMRHQSTGGNYNALIGLVMLAIALVFVWRSFYAMRIPKKGASHGGGSAPARPVESTAIKVH